MNSKLTKHNTKGYLTIGLLLALFFSCDLLSEPHDENPLARVKDMYLYPEDLENLYNPEMNANDSARIRANYIHNWINEMLLLDKAELNLKESQKDFQKQMESYRNSLLIYEYEKKIIEQSLDTQVTQSEIQEYYEANLQNFTLKDDVVLAQYSKIPSEAPKLQEARRWYKSDKTEDKNAYVDYCLQFASIFQQEKSWMYLNDFVELVPLQLSIASGQLKNNSYLELSDSTAVYFIQIGDFKIKNSPTPLSMEKKRIASIILNQRKLSLIKKMKSDLYNRALVKKDFELYD